MLARYHGKMSAKDSHPRCLDCTQVCAPELKALQDKDRYHESVLLSSPYGILQGLAGFIPHESVLYFGFGSTQHPGPHS